MKTRTLSVIHFAEAFKVDAYCGAQPGYGQRGIWFDRDPLGVTCNKCVAAFTAALEAGIDVELAESALCHCGRPANDCGNGMEDICDFCLADWEAAGEPETCPRCVAA